MSAIANSHSQGRWFATIGACLQIMPANLTIGTAINLARNIHHLASQPQYGSPDPARLSALIGEAIIAVTAGMLISLVGAVLILIAIHFKRYRAPWLFWLLTILGVLYLPALPLGTIIGLGFLILAIATRKTMLGASPK